MHTFLVIKALQINVPSHYRNEFSTIILITVAHGWSGYYGFFYRKWTEMASDLTKTGLNKH